MNGRRIYVDHAATTPMREEAIAAMLPYLASAGFNASSAHAEGRRARAGLDDARARVAAVLGARPREIVFTGSGSEADTLALVGTVRAARASGRRDPHVVTVATEHRAVLRAVEGLREDGVAVTVLGVDGEGSIDPAAFARALRPETVIASVMLANSEIGTLAPIAELAAIARARRVLFHSDAVQAPGRVTLDVTALGIDLLSLSGHKFYGPKGVGMLYVRDGTPLAPVVRGGSQEGGLRAGTENVAGIVAFARALELGAAELEAERMRLAGLRDRFEASLAEALPDIRFQGARQARLPNLASIAFGGTDATELVPRLDLEGVAVSAGSACAAGAVEPSHVLAALGGPRSAQVGTIRFSFGKLTTEDDVEPLVRSTVRSVLALREVPADVHLDAGISLAPDSEVCS